MMDDYDDPVGDAPDAAWRAKPRAGRPRFYWEMTDAERRAIDGHVLAEEGYLATDINHGRRLVRLSVDEAVLPDLEPLERPAHEAQEDFVNRFSDAIARILTAAEWDGIDPAWLCERAMRTSTLLQEEASDAARDRPGVAATSTVADGAGVVVDATRLF